MTGKIEMDSAKAGSVAGLIPVESELVMTVRRANGTVEELGVVARAKMPRYRVMWRKFLRLIGKG